MRLQSVQTLSSESRNSSVDIFRAVAIITVVLFHFNHFFRYGYLGVDLFFVISGLLVGGLLTKKFKDGQKINFFEFFLQRGFKIWPSFFTYLIIGNIAAYFLFKNIAPDLYIPLAEIPRYAFFYMNYDLYPAHWDFDHAWSLCIEEHFYIILPIVFILLRLFNSGVKTLFIVTSLLIVTGIVFKGITYYKDSVSEAYYFETQNRIDALAWGVLMNLVITYAPDFFKKITKYFIVFSIGFILFIATLYIDKTSGSNFFHRVLLHTFIPLSFFLMIAGLYHSNFHKLKILRFVAYYSYNWYLWHPLVAMIVLTFMGFSYTSLALYVVSSFVLAMLFTILIEEPFLKYRKTVLSKLFKKKVVSKGFTKNKNLEQSIIV